MRAEPLAVSRFLLSLAQTCDAMTLKQPAPPAPTFTLEDVARFASAIRMTLAHLGWPERDVIVSCARRGHMGILASVKWHRVRGEPRSAERLQFTFGPQCDEQDAVVWASTTLQDHARRVGMPEGVRS